MITKSRLVCLFLIAAFVIVACTTNVPNTIRPTSSPETNTSTIAPTISSATKPPAAPNTVIPPTPTPYFQTLEIESGDPRYVSKAFWSDDGKTVYYAFARSGGSKPLQWAAYDMTTHLTTIISSPLKYDPSIWKRLNIPDPDPNGGYTELQGFMSPSGGHVIYGVYRGRCTSTGICDPNNPPITEIWLGDVATRHKTKVGEIPGGWGISEVIWFDNEAKAALNLSDATASSYVVDLQTGKIKPLEQIANIRILESIWSTDISPDGKTIAAINGYELWLITLSSGKAVKVDHGVEYAHWPTNSQMVYYDVRSEGSDEFRVYDTTSGVTSTLLSEPYLSGPIGLDFAVSPNGNKVVFWGGWLRLIDLNK